MIVACPSCRQRYRHLSAAGLGVATARCSACDERFPLLSPKAPYRILDLTPRTFRAGAPGAHPAVTAGRPLEIEVPVQAPVAVPARLERDPLGAGVRHAAAHATGSGSAAPPGRLLGEATIALGPCAAGAGLAYHFAGVLGRDPITAAAMGAAVGLLLGWTCLLWITRRK